VSTPAPRYVCPRCRASYVTPLRFCQQCGADMQRASALEEAARREGVSSEDLAAASATATRRAEEGRADTSDPGGAGWVSAADRRVSVSAQTWLGKIVDGRYRVIEVVGRGGMGVVYKVEHVRMGKMAAMKVLHKDLAEDPDVVRRFEQEAAAVSRLQHANTVQVFDFGNALGALYLIMEYVRGQDLGHIIERDGPLPFARAAPLLVQICGALAEAHELGIVHRDLKPENVLITRTTGGRDFAKVLDFGLAKLGAREQSPSVTDRAEIVGTPYFMSPEQIRGDDVDARADIYSLGALMYTVMTGKPPFTAKSAVGVLTKHLTADLVPPSAAAPELGLTGEIDAIVARAMAKDPGARWQSIAEMGAAIEAIYAEQVGDASPHAMPRARGRMYTEEDEPMSELRLRRADIDEFERALRRRKTMSSGVMVTVMLAAGGVAMWWLWLRTPGPSRAELEPNDDDARATLIAPGTDVTGFLGKRISRGEPDRDVFHVEWGAAETHLVTVRVSGLPNLDVRLTLRDGREQLVAEANEAPVGGGEALHRWRVTGSLRAEVTEAMRPGQTFPTENVSDPYTLTVTVEEEDAGWETEPNSNATDATPIAPGSAMRGWLDGRNDVDLLRWDGEGGKVVVELAADSALPVAWRGPDGAAHGRGATTIQLAKGKILKVERADRDRTREQGLPGADAPWTLTVTPAK
jgi:serine/threonine protein kinase